MSRCFPYPPPGYCRNGATYEALIESIKLQKETVKTKAERKEKKAKKEKKEKRQKEKRNNEVELKLQKNTSGDSIKLLHKAADCTESQIKKTKTTTEPFEKSDLTEEYGQPIGQHQPSYSSDSTQNSNKRKRDDSSLPHDSSVGHGKGKLIKIRLLKKHNESDSTSVSADARLYAHPSVPSSSNFDISLASTVTKNGVLARAGMKKRIQTEANEIFKESKIIDLDLDLDLNRRHFSRIQSVPNSVKPVHPSGPKKSVMEVHQPISRLERQVLPPVCLEHEIPSSSISRHGYEHEFGSCRQQQQVPGHNGMHNHVSNKSAAVKQHAHETALPRNDCLTSIKKQKEDPPKVGRPTRLEKKMLKKHSKYEKLIGGLFPPVFQAHLSDDGDDWLSTSKTSDSSISKVEFESCRPFVAPWQPCSRYLAEVDMHALPYTVPF